MTDANARIAEIVNQHDVVLFMKGTPLFPQCGFSSRAVAILDHLHVPFETVNVLQDPGSETASRTIPTGRPSRSFTSRASSSAASDIMMEMFEAGELKQLLEDKQVATAG